MALRRQTRLWLASASLLGLLALAGCSDERSFDAETLVAELNDAGAGLVLGETLPSTEESVEVRVVSFATGGDGGSAGAVVILADVAAAQSEFVRCEQAASFVCFRAANGVVRFTGLDPAGQRRMTGAVLAIEKDPDR
jgi:hypothetical protein